MNGITDLPAGELFNRLVVPKVNSLAAMLAGSQDTLEDARKRREERAQKDEAGMLFQRQESDDWFAANKPQRFTEDTPSVDYNSPLMPTQAPPTMGVVGDVAPAEHKDLVSLVKSFEGFNPNAYGDFKQTSIGYGTRAKAGEKSISKEEAERRLANELALSRQRVAALNEKAGYNFTPHEIDALTSFDYNTGRLSQLTENGKRDRATIAAKMLEYTKAGGKSLPGLVKRRNAERQVFLQGYSSNK